MLYKGIGGQMKKVKLRVILTALVLLLLVETAFATVAQAKYDEGYSVATVQIKQIFTEKEYKEAQEALSRTMFAEGGASVTNHAAVGWCVINRWYRANKNKPIQKCKRTIRQICAARNQFAYKAKFSKSKERRYQKVKKKWLKLAADILDRVTLELNGVKDVGRVLPKGYYYFAGNGKWNRFRKYYKAPYRKQKYLIPKYSEVYEK
jgi:hypothetical protein